MSTNEAVEAAGGVLVHHQRNDITSCMCGWSELGKSHAVHQAQLALEAAAPHLMAGLRAELVGLAGELNTATIDQFGIRRNPRDQLMQIVHQHLDGATK
jgi:hypothetical protein